MNKIIIEVLIIIILIPLTIFAGMFLFDDKRYMFISIMIILEIMLPFFIRLEKKNLSSRRLVIIAVLCAIAVGGRVAFAAFQQIKPISAVVIIAGVCFGGQTGFLVGAVSALVSNMYFGQGPWTPWQMLAFGLLGFVAGIIFYNKNYKHKSIYVCVYGLLSVVCIFGLIINFSSFLYQPTLSLPVFLSTLWLGLGFDVIHASSTMIILFLIYKPFVALIDRLKLKYNI